MSRGMLKACRIALEEELFLTVDKNGFQMGKSISTFAHVTK